MTAPPDSEALVLIIEGADFSDLLEYASVSIAFEVTGVLVVDDVTLEATTVEPVPAPWTKDYDAGSPISSVSEQFDTRNWACWIARDEGVAVGGAMVAFDTAGVDMLENRDDLAVLWDLRVAREHRGHGVGRALLERVADWAAEQRCTELRVETQDINARACAFYSRHGFRLLSAQAGAYPEHPAEKKLVWTMPVRSGVKLL